MIVRDKTLAIMKKGVSFFVTIALLALASFLAYASDPSPLQDTCVSIAEPKNAGIYIMYIKFPMPFFFFLIILGIRVNKSFSGFKGTQVGDH